MKKLVRNNVENADNVEILNDTEFLSTALEQISTTALNLKEVDATDKLLDGFSDILELLSEVLLKNNINPKNAFIHAENLRQEKGTFHDKKAINKD